jgi:hypothetical protein
MADFKATLPLEKERPRSIWVAAHDRKAFVFSVGCCPSRLSRETS